MKRRNYARDKAVRTQSAEDWQEYRCLRNTCTQLVRKDKAEHINKIFKEHDEGKDISKL